MRGIERVVYELKSFNFTKVKLEANVLLAAYLEDVDKLAQSSNMLTAVYYNSKIKARTDKLIADIIALGDSQPGKITTTNTD